MEGGAGAPSAAVFPDGEGLAGMQARAVAAVRRHDARIAAEHGPHAVWLACSHGDVIKAVLADALATHLDNFQRIMVDTCSISVVHYTADPAVRRPGQRPRRRRRGPRSRPRPRRRRKAAGRPAPTPWWAEPRDGDVPRAPEVAYSGYRHVPCHSRLPPARALRRGHRRRARRPLLLPAGHRGLPHGERAAGEAAGLACSPSASPRCSPRSPAGSVRACPRPAGRRPRSAGRAAGGGVPRRHDGSGLGRRLQSIVVELLAVTEEEVDESVVLDDTEEGPDALRVFLSPGRPRRSPTGPSSVVSAGRPPCPLCAEPLDPDGPRLRPAQRVPPEVSGRGVSYVRGPS